MQPIIAHGRPKRDHELRLLAGLNGAPPTGVGESGPGRLGSAGPQDVRSPTGGYATGRAEGDEVPPLRKRVVDLEAAWGVRSAGRLPLSA